MVKYILTAVMALAILVTIAMGAPLPDGSQPMSREAVTKLYSGVTYIYDTGKKELNVL
jgi:hypothetical protein